MPLPRAGVIRRSPIPNTFEEAEAMFKQSMLHRDFQFFKCVECGKHIWANFNLFQKHIMEFHGGWEKKSALLKPFKLMPTNL